MATAQQIQVNRNRAMANKPQKTASQTVASFMAKRKNPARSIAVKTSTGLVKLPQNQNQTTQKTIPNLSEARVNAVMKPAMPTAQRTGMYDKTLATVWEGGVQKTNPDYIPNAQKISIKNEREQMLRDQYYNSVNQSNQYLNRSNQTTANRMTGINDLANLQADKITEAARKDEKFARQRVAGVNDLANSSIEAQNIASEKNQADYGRATANAELDRQANRIRSLRAIANSNIAGGSTAQSMQTEVDKAFNDTLAQLTDNKAFNDRLIANTIENINTKAQQEIDIINNSLLTNVQKAQAIQQIQLEAQQKQYDLEDQALQRENETQRYQAGQLSNTTDKVLQMRDTQEVRAEDKRRYEQGQMSAQEQRNYERNQDSINQKLKGLEYIINSTPYGQSVQVPQELQQALGLPSTIRGGDNTMIDNAIKNMQLSQGQLNLAEGQLDYQGKQAKYAETYGLNQIIGGTDRASRHNNPTAMTTDVAKTLGLVEGVDYERGDAFPDNPNLFTARLLGDPIETTIKALDESAKSEDRQAFYTQKGQQRWTYLGMSDEEWLKKSPTEKTQIIKNMYKKEGGKGNFVTGESQQLGTKESLLVEKLLKPGGTKEERDDNRKRITELINKGITDESELSKMVYGQDLTPEKLKSVNILADDLRNNQKYRNMVDIENGYLNVKSGIDGNNAQGDLALIYGFNKMLDPNSVVREGEFATTEEAQGLVKRLLNWPGKIMTGNRLLPEVRQAFLKQANNLYNQKANDFNNSVGKNFKDRATAYGVDPVLIGQLDFNQNKVNNAVKASKPGIQYSKPAGPQKPLSIEDEDIASRYGIN